MVKHLFRIQPGFGIGAGGRKGWWGDDSVENGGNVGTVEDRGEEVSVEDAEDARNGDDERGVVVMLVAMVSVR
jgi:hypothetical protein